MDDKKNQSSQWDFSELQKCLENFYDSPEALLMEAYKGLFELINTDSDTDKETISRAAFPISLILSSVYNTVIKRK